MARQSSVCVHECLDSPRARGSPWRCGHTGCLCQMQQPLRAVDPGAPARDKLAHKQSLSPPSLLSALAVGVCAPRADKGRDWGLRKLSRAGQRRLRASYAATLSRS